MKRTRTRHADNAAGRPVSIVILFQLGEILPTVPPGRNLDSVWDNDSSLEKARKAKAARKVDA